MSSDEKRIAFLTDLKVVMKKHNAGLYSFIEEWGDNRDYEFSLKDSEGQTVITMDEVIDFLYIQ